MYNRVLVAVFNIVKLFTEGTVGKGSLNSLKGVETSMQFNIFNK